MSVVVTCTIKIEQQTYDVPTGGEVFTESHWTSIAGAFEGLPREILQNLVESAADGARDRTTKRLDLIKGNKRLSQQDTRSTKAKKGVQKNAKSK